MKRALIIVKRIIIFSVLTVLTQTGGIIYLVSMLVAKRIKYRLMVKTTLTFIVIYALATFIIVPLIAPIWGREKIVNSPNIKPVSFLTVVLNRDYVTPQLNSFLIKLADNQHLIDNAIQVRYLDACFPFFNGFPLFPHLSHYDGKKIDLGLVYENTEGEITNESKSITGYGVFENPKKGEYNQTKICKKEGHFQYDFSKYLTLGKINGELIFSEKGTKLLLQSILGTPGLGKIFIEPHLKERLGLKDYRIRFQGCHSVRHDDHIHIQLK